MLLKIENIEFAYNKETKILNGITLTNEDNQLMSIVGVSGCGKSTLLKIIAGLLPNSKGNYFNGKISIDNKNPEEFRKTGKLSFMFQESTLMPNLTVKENIQLPLKILKKPFNGKVDNLLDMVGLNEYSNYLPKELSGGMKTRVALARSFISEPKLLLLDEPFTALDIVWREDLYRNLKNLRHEFETMVIMVTHDIDEAIIQSDKIIAIGIDGQILGEFKELKKDKEFVSNAILRNYKRNSINYKDFLNNLEIIRNAVENDQQFDSHINQAIQSIRKYSNDKSINSLLIDIWNKSNNEFKQELLWDLLNYSNLSESMHFEIFNFVKENTIIFIKGCKRFYVGNNQDNLNIYEWTLQSIIYESMPISKRWIYLFQFLMCENDSKEKANVFLKNIIEENEVYRVFFSYPFAKEVATWVKDFINNKK